jgi:hypothetical protein
MKDIDHQALRMRIRPWISPPLASMFFFCGGMLNLGFSKQKSLSVLRLNIFFPNLSEGRT